MYHHAWPSCLREPKRSPFWMIDWNDHPYGHGVVGYVYHKEQQSIFYAENNIVFNILSRKKELKKKRFLHTEGGLLICSHGKLFSSAYTGRPFG